MEVVSLSECWVSFFKYQVACWQQGRAGKHPPALPNGADKHHQLQEKKWNPRILLPSVCYAVAKPLFSVTAKGSLNMLQYRRNAFPLKKLLHHKQWPLSCLKCINYCSCSASEWLPVGNKINPGEGYTSFSRTGFWSACLWPAAPNLLPFFLSPSTLVTPRICIQTLLLFWHWISIQHGSACARPFSRNARTYPDWFLQRKDPC